MNTTTQLLYQLLQNKTDQERQEFITGLVTGEAIVLQTVILSVLTQEDFEVIDLIIDDDKAQQEIVNRFKVKISLTPDEFINKLHKEILHAT